MTRDMDLVRKILLTLEEHPHGFARHPFSIEGYDAETVGYHVYLMGEGQGSLLRVVDVTTHASQSPYAEPVNLTWQGHEFLDNAKNDSVWSQTKRVVREKGGSVSFEILKELVLQIARAQVLGP